jgi:hypothetical protein
VEVLGLTEATSNANGVVGTVCIVRQRAMEHETNLIVEKV